MFVGGRLYVTARFHGELYAYTITKMHDTLEVV